MNSDVSDPKHVKIATYTAIDDDTLNKVTNSYFDTLTQTKEEIIKSIKTDHNNFLSDVISCLDVINNVQTKELNIKITLDEWNKPSMIVKQYTTKKEDYKRR